MAATIEARGLEKRYGKTRGPRRARPGRRARAGRGRARVPTGPARRRSSGRWRRCCASTRERCASPGTTSRREPERGPRVDRAGGPVRRRRARDERAREPGDGRRASSATTAGRRARARRRVLEQLGLVGGRPTGSRAPTRAACAAGSTSARAWSARPRLLLLDEPTTGLDPRSRIELWDAIRALVESGTDVLLTTQYLDEADHLAGRIVIVDHGRAVATGTPAELKRRIGGNVSSCTSATPATCRPRAEVLDRLDGGAARIDDAHAPRERRRRRAEATGCCTPSAPCRTRGIEIDDIALRQPDLDEVFLALTGQPAATSRLTTRRPRPPMTSDRHHARPRRTRAGAPGLATSTSHHRAGARSCATCARRS